MITDVAAAPVRPTKDVDLIVEVGSWREDAPLCRWVIEGIRVDVMPTNAEVLGFTNRWYGPTREDSQNVQLNDDLTIRLVTAPYFVATKIEAFKGRGSNDFRLSHDLEDVIAVIDGRPELIDEIVQAEQGLRAYLHDQVKALLDTDAFRESLPGHLPGDAASQARVPAALARLAKIACYD